MANETSQCVYCGITSEDAPLVVLEYKGEKLYICSQHLPILIHHPHELAGKLPGAENLQGHSH